MENRKRPKTRKGSENRQRYWLLAESQGGFGGYYGIYQSKIPVSVNLLEVRNQSDARNHCEIRRENAEFHIR